MKDKIHDFISMFGAKAFINSDLDLTIDYHYIKYLSECYGQSVSPFDVDTSMILRGVAPQPVEVVRGTWTTVCSVCDNRSLIRRTSEFWICMTCALDESMNDGHSFSTVVWRSDYRDIENILLKRPRSSNRNAYWFETVEDLTAENKENL